MVAALDIEWPAVLLTLRLASVTTLVLLVLGTPLAWWLARTRSRARPWIGAAVSVPLVLPPTVLGFYLLVLLAPDGPVGRVVEALDLPPLVFSFPGLVIGSTVFSLPFVVQPLRDAFAALGSTPLEAAATLGARPIDRFFTVAVPMCWPAFVTAATLGFAHTVGEFGVVLMIGGNVPGVTRVVSIAIYDAWEAGRTERAHDMALLMLGFAFLVLSIVNLVRTRAAAVAP